MLKENPLPPPKPPNLDILNHNRLWMIEGKLFLFSKKLEGLSEDEKKERVEQERQRLIKEDRESKIQQPKDTHSRALWKEEVMKKITKAFNISDQHERGAAFDIELQETKRLQRLREYEEQSELEKQKLKDQRRQQRKAEKQKTASKLPEVKIPELRAPLKEGGEIQSSSSSSRSWHRHSSSSSHRRRRRSS